MSALIEAAAPGIGLNVSPGSGRVRRLQRSPRRLAPPRSARRSIRPIRVNNNVGAHLAHSYLVRVMAARGSVSDRRSWLPARRSLTHGKALGGTRRARSARMYRPAERKGKPHDGRRRASRRRSGTATSHWPRALRSTRSVIATTVVSARASCLALTFTPAYRESRNDHEAGKRQHPVGLLAAHASVPD
jgi:hypothetical protein